MSITEHPEFKRIVMEVYDKAYSHGQRDERERCAKLADQAASGAMNVAVALGEDRSKASFCMSQYASEIAAKIRSAKDVWKQRF